MSVNIYPKVVFKVLMVVIFVLLLADIAGIVSKIYFNHGRLYGLVPWFNFNNELSVPTLYSSLALLLASGLLLWIALIEKSLNKSWVPWLGFMLLFLFLCIDESVTIHEQLTEPFRDLLHLSGVFYYAWIVPYGVAFLVFSAVYCKFLISLPRQQLGLFILSGVVFLSGAIGLEMAGGNLASVHSEQGLAYALCYTGEEFLEMTGVAIFVYSLLFYISRYLKPAVLVIEVRNET
ncbi:hypothetical protein [Desulfogranum mediterraneum]|uniref:hypothetical protein n=1 Tax=Desulfogranum mediterraneum TaxID=160661 RepID=UPI00040DB30A|nr:hypothetical protein [Desulfogranum mediterraneum]